MQKKTHKKDLPGKPTLNVLFISLDKNLLRERQGDALPRHRRYSKYFKILNIIVLTTKKHGFKKTYRNKNLHIFPTNSLSRWTFISDALKIATALNKKQKIDVVSAQDPFITATVALILKRKFGVTINIQVHNDFFDNQFWKRESIQNRIFFFFGKYALKKADTIRVVSEKIERSLQRFIPHQITVRKIPVSPSRVFLKPKLKLRKTIDIIGVGRLDQQKNFSMLLRSIASVKKDIPNIKAHIIGEGPDKENLTKLTNKLKIQNNVMFDGSLSHKILIDLLAKSKLYVSTSRYEGLSIALLEAMLLGLPVVVSKVSGADEVIVNGKNGFIAGPEDKESVAKNVSTLLFDGTKQKEMGKKARSTVLSLLKENWERKWVELLKETAVDRNIKMKHANIDHYNKSLSEIEKAERNPSKLVYYPKLTNWLKSNMHSGQLILDNGGGAGVLMRRVEDEVRNLKIIGLDISILMTKFRSDIGLRRNIVADMEKVPIKSNSVDVVVFIASLHHTINTNTVLQESHRVLKRYGKLLLIEHNSLRFLLYPKTTGAIPAPDDPRECLINHRLVVKQLHANGFKVKHASLHRQSVTIAEAFTEKIPLRLYQILTVIDGLTNWIPGYKEIGSLMIIGAEKV